jgi:hypothetical protein
MYLVIAQILLVIAILGGELPAHFCNRYQLSVIKNTKGLGENGGNCNVTEM